MSIGVSLSAARLAATVLVAIVGSSGLLACSGEESTTVNHEGDAGIDAPAAPDEEPPTVVSVSPVDWDDNVSVDTPIQITFSEAVKIGASPVTIIGSGSSTVATRAALSDDQKTLTITPVAGLVAPVKLTATIGEITDLGGNRLASSPSWSWSLPRWLTVADQVVPIEGNRPLQAIPDRASVAAGPGQRISVATQFRDSNSNRTTVFVHTVDAYRGTWTQLGGALDAAGSSRPSLIVDRTGALIVAFADNRNSLRVQRWSGSFWEDLGRGSPGPLPANVYGRPPSMAFQSNGTLVMASEVAVVEGGSTRTHAVVRTLSNDTWAQLGGTVNDPATEVGYSPTLALAAGGTPYVMYDTNPLRARWWTGSSWNLLGDRIPPANEYGGIATMTFDESGRLYALVQCDDNVNDNYRLIAWTGGWSPVGTPIVTRSRSSANGIFLGATPGNRLFALTRGVTTAAFAAEVSGAGVASLDVPSGTGSSDVNGGAIDPRGAPIISYGRTVKRLNR